MNPILECRALSKGYANYPATAPALDKVTLSLPRGGIVGLLGPNGSGKTTLIKLAAGMLTPSDGEILVDGMAPGLATKAMVSYLPDRESLPLWMHSGDLLEYFSDFYADFDKAKAKDMLQRLEIPPKAKLKTLSKGNREKVQLAFAMARRAQLYLLDEPIGGVDPASRDFILDTIIREYNEDATVVLSTHLIQDVERVLDEVVFLANGHVGLQTTVDEIRETHGKSVDAYFREVYRC